MAVPTAYSGAGIGIVPAACFLCGSVIGFAGDESTAIKPAKPMAIANAIATHFDNDLSVGISSLLAIRRALIRRIPRAASTNGAYVRGSKGAPQLPGKRGAAPRLIRCCERCVLLGSARNVFVLAAWRTASSRPRPARLATGPRSFARFHPGWRGRPLRLLGLIESGPDGRLTDAGWKLHRANPGASLGQSSTGLRWHHHAHLRWIDHGGDALRPTLLGRCALGARSGFAPSRRSYSGLSTFTQLRHRPER